MPPKDLCPWQTCASRSVSFLTVYENVLWIAKHCTYMFITVAIVLSWALNWLWDMDIKTSRNYAFYFGCTTLLSASGCLWLSSPLPHRGHVTSKKITDPKLPFSVQGPGVHFRCSQGQSCLCPQGDEGFTGFPFYVPQANWVSQTVQSPGNQAAP